MHIQRAGLQLLKGSDVKMRGLIVGDVASISSNGNGAVIKLRLKPKYLNRHPGKRETPADPEDHLRREVRRPRHADQSVGQAHRGGRRHPPGQTTPALEIDQALNDLLPLLRTVRPQDLNSTLSAMA